MNECTRNNLVSFICLIIFSLSLAHLLLELIKLLLLLLILRGSRSQLVLQVDRLSLDLALFGHESLLLELQVLNDVFEVTDGLVEEVASIILMCNLLLQLIQSIVELVSLRILDPDLGLQLSHLCVAIFLQLLLVFLELHQLIVEHLDLLFLGGENVLMVPLQSKVVHLGVALITHPIKRGVVLGQLAPLITASLTDGSPAALTVFLRIPLQQLDLPREGSLAEHAVVCLLFADFANIEGLWEGGLVEQAIRVETSARIGHRHHHRLRRHIVHLLTHPALRNWTTCV